MLGCHPAAHPSISQGQNTQPNMSGNMITVAGVAGNAKLGAHLSADADSYYLDALSAWPDSVLGKTVVVTGRLKTMTHSKEELTNARGEVSQGMVGEQRILEQATWHLQE
jgi:hypothetical protein